jgi:hypothetical protein
MNRLAIALAALVALSPLAALADEQPQASTSTVIYSPTTSNPDSVPGYVNLDIAGA